MINRHTKRAILAAILAAGIITPAQSKAALWVPQAPAIIKPDKFWLPHEKQLQLAMPITLGMFKGGAGAAPAFSYRDTYTVGVGANSSFATCDLGTPHPLRMNVIIARCNDDSVTAMTVDGVTATLVVQVTSAGARMSMWRAAAIANPTGTIALTHTSSLTSLISVYAGYPTSHTPVDALANADADSQTVLSDLAKTNGGFTILMAFGNNNSSGLGIAHNGAEVVVENDDRALGASDNCIVSASHVNTATTTLDDYTAVQNTATLTAIIGASWF